MALTDSPRSRVYDTAANMAVTQFQILTRSGTSEDVVPADASSTILAGIAMETRAAAGAGVKKAVTVALPGEMYDAIASGSIDAFTPLTFAADGKVAAAASGNRVIGTSLADAAADDDVIPIRIASAVAAAV